MTAANLPDLRALRAHAAAIIEQLSDEFDRHPRPTIRHRINALAELVDALDSKLELLST
jgi:hypothetical protein